MTITTTDTGLDTRVARGAALFDERYPGWEDIDRDALNMGDSQFCVAAQVVCNSRDGDDSYINAMEALGFTSDAEAIEHGFSLSWQEVRCVPLASARPLAKAFAPLTAAWLRAIDARLESAS